MRNMDACLYVGPSDRMTLERLIADGKTPQKIFKRATILIWALERQGRSYGTFFLAVSLFGSSCSFLCPGPGAAIAGARRTGQDRPAGPPQAWS